MKKKPSKSAPDTCPVCGTELPRAAKSCPECGSDHSTGWSEEAYSSGLDLPDDEFNYDEFVEKEFGKKTTIKPPHMHWFWWVVGVGLIFGCLAWSMRHFF